MEKSTHKGKAGERELAARLTELGVEARRGVQYAGGPGSPDVVAEIRGVHLECKRVERLRLYPALCQAACDAALGDIPVVAHRANRQGWVAIMSLEHLVQLLREAGRVS